MPGKIQAMRLPIRLGAIMGLMLFFAARAVAALLGLIAVAGPFWGVAAVAALSWLRCIRVLQIAIFLGALTVWHWPAVLALFVAAPRAFLVLPGLIATFLANRRHPRAHWPRTSH
jgi:hypothetical protein